MTSAWQPFATVPKVRDAYWFRWADGRVRKGRLTPYWCGSDCPCYDLDEGPSEPLTSYPACWAVVNHALENLDGFESPDPTEWQPITIDSLECPLD